MKAIGYRHARPISADDSLVDITLPDPVASGRDLLVEVHAVSVNPVDTKVRASSSPADGQTYKVLGYDASGIVRAVGPDVTLFKPGDKVWYAGSIARPGTNSELHLVDERIVGHMPASLDFAQAAALPLTDELTRIGIPAVDYLVSLTHTDDHIGQIIEALGPQGKFGLIDDPKSGIDINRFKRKSISVHWELMFTRSLFETTDMIGQHHLLNEVAQLVDAGVVRTTLAENYGPISAANLKRAHALVESGKARGKVVLAGWE